MPCDLSKRHAAVYLHVHAHVHGRRHKHTTGSLLQATQVSRVWLGVKGALVQRLCLPAFKALVKFAAASVYVICRACASVGCALSSQVVVRRGARMSADSWSAVTLGGGAVAQV